jgi:broad specificity phosphatase PhoE
MKIVLARHGQPNFDYGSWMAPREMPEWLERFNRASVLPHEVPAATLASAASSAIVVCSTLSRSIQSARRLAANRTVLVEALFCEADLPYAAWRVPELPFRVWTALFRAGWFCGFSAHAEPLSAATVRAELAAQRLLELARESGSVFLIGHGIMNRLVARQLRARGAVGPLSPSHGWWQCSEYLIPRDFPLV